MTTEADAIAGVDRLGLVLARQGQAMNLRLRQALRTSSLSPRQGATLMHLATVGATSQQALLDALAIDPSALVAILNELEGGGLLHRSRDPQDRRRHTVEITPAGRDAIEAIEHAIAEVEREAFADLNAAEIATLHQLLARVRPRNDVCVEDC